MPTDDLGVLRNSSSQLTICANRSLKEVILFDPKGKQEFRILVIEVFDKALAWIVKAPN